MSEALVPLGPYLPQPAELLGEFQAPGPYRCQTHLGHCGSSAAGTSLPGPRRTPVWRASNVSRNPLSAGSGRGAKQSHQNPPERSSLASTRDPWSPSTAVHAVSVVKLYDKAFTELGCLMRVEATFNSVNDFRVYRPKEGDPKGEPAWRPLRRGIADLHRRAEVSRKATERYLDALASVDEDTTLDDILHRLGQPTYWHGRRVRAPQPFAPDDRQLIQAISRGEFTINGVRNRDLQRLYFVQPAHPPLSPH